MVRVTMANGADHLILLLALAGAVMVASDIILTTAEWQCAAGVRVPIADDESPRRRWRRR